MAVGTTTTEVARNGHTPSPLTRTTRTVSTTSDMNLTSYLAKPCLQVGGAVGVGVPARARNRSPEEWEGEERGHRSSADGGQRGQSQVKRGYYSSRRRCDYLRHSTVCKC